MENKLVPEGHVSFYALWASRFLSFSNRHQDKAIELRKGLFLDSLTKDQKLQDWQVEQADNAIRLYINHFLSDDISSLSPNAKSDPQNKLPDYQGVLQKLQEAIRIKHYAYSTERTYMEWFKRFYNYVTSTKGKHWQKDGADETDVRDFLSHLAIAQRVSSSTQNQAFNALLFLFREVLKINLQDISKTVRAKRGPKLPAVLTQDEVLNLLDQLTGRELLIVQLLYGTGMRLMEVARLRVQDIDFGLNSIVVRAGKGDKDRMTVMPELVKESLKEHLCHVMKIHEKDLEKGYGEVHLPEALDRKYTNAAKEWGWQYVFPSASLSVDPRSGKVRRHHISPSSIQKIVARAVKKAGIVKHASVHTLRHSFATHLLMNGVNIREVQELLGHKNVETTMIYTHVLRNMSKAPMSPLDTLLLHREEQTEPGNGDTTS
ncbi:MAG: integron integrase [Syntrophales bacterium]|nr:integron integrase [Syntrophales bacterium]